MKRRLGIIIAIGGAMAVAVAGIVSAAPGGGADTPATQAKKAEKYDEDELFMLQLVDGKQPGSAMPLFPVQQFGLVALPPLRRQPQSDVSCVAGLVADGDSCPGFAIPVTHPQQVPGHLLVG